MQSRVDPGFTGMQSRVDPGFTAIQAHRKKKKLQVMRTGVGGGGERVRVGARGSGWHRVTEGGNYS